MVLQTYYRSQGDKGRTIAYGKALNALRTVDKNIINISQVKGIRGIGPKVIAKIQEYLDTGKIQTVENKKEEIKKSVVLSKKDGVLLELEQIWGVGPVKAKQLYDKGIRSVQDLFKHTELLTDQQRIGLKYREDLLQKIPRDTITSIFIVMSYFLNKRYGKGTYDMEIAGSYRRGNLESGDIDCLISSRNFDMQSVADLLKEKKIITEVLSMRKQKMMGIGHCPSGGGFHFRIDIEFVDQEEWGSALLYFTGSKGFNVYMRAHAKSKGMLLSEHGLYSIRTGRKILTEPTEEDIFRELGIPYTAPERR